MEADDWSVIISDGYGCEAVVDFTISEPEVLLAEVIVTDPLCNGDLGSAEIIVTGGTEPYLWTDDLSALSAGTYTTSVNDANGCLVPLEFEVIEPGLLEASVSVTDPLCNGNLGSAEIIVTGGTAP